MDWRWLVIVAVAVLFATKWFVRWGRSENETLTKFNVGGITLETLSQYCGMDFSKPILLAIRGKVYDVTPSGDQFGPGNPLQAYAGKEVSRALAKNSKEASDLGSDVLHDLDQESMERLNATQAEFDNKYDVVGEVVPLRDLTLQELSQHNGVTKPSLYLAIQGLVFDVSKGRQFYGPDGVYPFAGHECARALALMSTEPADCNDKVDDLGYLEKENLREWKAKFTYKYPIVGRLIQGGLDAGATNATEAKAVDEANTVVAAENVAKVADAVTKVAVSIADMAAAVDK